MADESRYRLLLVEDDAVIGEATQLGLERRGFDVRWVTDGLQGLDAFMGAMATEPFDLVLADIMLPELDGVSLCRQIRAVSTISVVLVSARGDTWDVVTGLEAGADDYLTKPFDIQVLLARLRSVLRRSGSAPAPSPSTELRPVERFGDLELDRGALELRRGGAPVPLTATEMRLFLELADAAGTVLSRSTLLSRVWDYEWDETTHLVTVHIQRLRAKIGGERIETVRGFGYKLVP
jgi:two-component system response regulator MtrA